MKERLREVFRHRLHEFLREFGLLWLVFAVLDRLVAEKLTPRWITTHLAIGIASWVIGIYIEARSS